MKKSSKVLLLGIVAISIVVTGLSFAGILQVKGQQVDISDLFSPTAWMGDTEGIFFDDHWTDDPHSGSTCIRISYNSVPAEVTGIYWEYQPGRDMTNTRKVIFWAKGETGSESAEFLVGGMNGDSINPAISTGVIKPLTSDWKRYEIDLTGKDLRHVIGGFGWLASGPGTIYLDDMSYELS